MRENKMKHVIISLGANLGDRIATIEAAYEGIESTCGRIVNKSSFYSSPPWGFDSDQFFINSVIQIETKLTLRTLFNRIQTIEKKLGRTEKSHKNNYEDRLIDIDIIDYEQIVFSSKTIILPHSRMHLRHFVLVPLAEIAPNWIHPESLKSIEEILAELPMNQTIDRINSG